MNYNNSLFDFIEKCPTQFHAVRTITEKLASEGFEALSEKEEWELCQGKKYFVTRNGSSVIAFVVPNKDFGGFQIISSHSDSPTFRIKENPEMEVEGQYVKLNVEKYGGMLMAPWFDRPLSVAGRIIVRNNGKLETRLINLDRDLCMIVNLAIHMNRDANTGYDYNAQKDMLPLYGMNLDGGHKKLLELVAKEAGVEAEDIVGNDLFLYNRQTGSVWGAENEFISMGRLDDLQCAFGSLEGIINAAKEGIQGNHIPVYCVFDNEEVGSGTKQGADSTFLYDTLTRINDAFGRTGADYLRSVAKSFMISADNAQGLHPNYADKSCPTNKVFLNGGIAIKYSANQKYTTDGVSAAVFKEVCRTAGVKVQTYINRSDILGGSTLGNISTSHVSMPTVDIGLPQLAMHSPYETAGAKDTEDLVKVATEFFKNTIDNLA